MKKKLEADLISIAHRILQMKNKSDVNQLYVETQKLYEKLSVLKFVEENFGDAKPTIGQAEVIEKLENNSVVISAEEIPTTNIQEPIFSQIIEEQTTIEEEVENETPNHETEIEETPIVAIEETILEEETITIKNEENTFVPSFELDEVEESPKKNPSVQISFEELLGANYDEPHFVKVDHNTANPLDFELPKTTNIQEERAELLAEIQVSPKDIEPKTAAAIENQAKIINIGLNDRIAFVKHLFGNSNEDYNRVLNQLITFDNFEEAQNFIDDMVKPDYNNWDGKEEYSERFIQIIEKKFA